MQPNELLNAIRTVHRGQQYIPPDVEQNWCSALAIQNCERELEVLGLMAQGMSNQTLLLP